MVPNGKKSWSVFCFVLILEVVTCPLPKNDSTSNYLIIRQINWALKLSFFTSTPVLEDRKTEVFEGVEESGPKLGLHSNLRLGLSPLGP